METKISKEIIMKKILLLAFAIFSFSASAVEKETNFSIEIIDLRTLNPLDLETIFSSIKKTNRVIIAHEDNITNGFGVEIVAQVVEEVFEYLYAPIKRVASKDSPVAYSSILENEILVQTDWISKAIQETMEY